MSQSFSLKKGHAGQEVVRLQRALMIPRPDGKFGPKTEAAVKDFQSKHGLVVDGVAGPNTLGKLGINLLLGIDVSHFQGKINWGLVKADGIRFAYVKATQNEGYKDPMFPHNVQGARRSGVPVGAYHFAVAGKNDDVVAEARHFVKYINESESLDLAPVLDLESNVNNLSSDDLQDWAIAWCREVGAATGKSPILYTGISFIKQKTGLGGGKKIADAGIRLWVARYHGADEVDPVTPGIGLGSFGQWDMWQFDQKGDVQGISGGVDRNWLPRGEQGLKDLHT